MLTQRQVETLRLEALRADEHFTSELQRVYGARAGDARYQWKHEDARVQSAMFAKLAADKAYWNASIARELGTEPRTEASLDQLVSAMLQDAGEDEEPTRPFVKLQAASGNHADTRGKASK